MKGQKQLFSSASDEWRTPPDKWAIWNNEFNFTFDAAASKENHLYELWSNDSLNIGWNGFSVWLNPPYSMCKEFVEKAWKETRKLPKQNRALKVVMLVPARTDTKWFHQYIYDEVTKQFKKGVSARFLKGRIKFLNEDGMVMSSAPFPSMLIIFDGSI